jgi:hypothetical protein
MFEILEKWGFSSTINPADSILFYLMSGQFRISKCQKDVTRVMWIVFSCCLLGMLRKLSHYYV